MAAGLVPGLVLGKRIVAEGGRRPRVTARWWCGLVISSAFARSGWSRHRRLTRFLRRVPLAPDDRLEATKGRGADGEAL